MANEKHYRHRLDVSCEKCGNQMAILEVQFDCEGNIYVQLACVKCAEELMWKVSMAELIRRAFETDLLSTFEGAA